MTKNDFQKMMLKLNSLDLDKPTFDEYSNRLFNLIDASKDQTLDRTEIANLLILLAEGTKQDKIEAAFKFYDINKDGALSLHELTDYFKGVLKMQLGAGDERLKHHSEEDLAKLAAASATKVFKDLGVGDAGGSSMKLSLKQFRDYVLNNGGNGGSA